MTTAPEEAVLGAECGENLFVRGRQVRREQWEQSCLWNNLQALAEHLPEEDNGFFPELHQHYQKARYLHDARLVFVTGSRVV